LINTKGTSKTLTLTTSTGRIKIEWKDWKTRGFFFNWGFSRSGLPRDRGSCHSGLASHLGPWKLFQQ
jgi:hypothetical protein